MASLSSCLRRLGKNLPGDDVEAVKASAREYRQDGMTATEAAKRAVTDRLSELQGEALEMSEWVAGEGGNLAPVFEAQGVSRYLDSEFSIESEISQEGVKVSQSTVEPVVETQQEAAPEQADVLPEAVPKVLNTAQTISQPAPTFIEDPNDPSILASRADTRPRGYAADSVRDAVNAALKRWDRPPNVITVQSPTQVPKALQEWLAETEQTEIAQGLFYVPTGQIYVIADNVRDMDAVGQTVLHEGFHMGLRAVMGDDVVGVLQEVLDTPRMSDRIAEVTDEYGFDMNVQNDRLAAAEETLARMAESDVQDRLLDRLVAAIRRWLRRVMPGLSYSEAEIRQLVALSVDAAGRQVGSASGMEDFGARAHRAWHGGPHRFDKFNTDKIGTGEGAQAYGYGLYFAGKKEVAEYYKDTLSSYQIDLEYEARARGLDLSRDARIELMRQSAVDRPAIDAAKSLQYASIEARAMPREKLADLIEAYRETKKGALYEVELAPAEDEYLLWDEPLSGQSEKVRKAVSELNDDELKETIIEQRLKNDDFMGTGYEISVDEEEGGYVAIDANGEYVRDLGGSIEVWDTEDEALEGMRDILIINLEFDQIVESGENLYRTMARIEQSDKAASEALHAAGIRGIKYLAGDSRAKGEGNFNYVIFSDEDVEIVARASRNDRARDAWTSRANQPSGDPDLDSARNKIGQGRKHSVIDSIMDVHAMGWQRGRQYLGDMWAAGMFDKFHGIKAAMRDNGIQVSDANDPYLSARRSTGLASVMNAVLSHGAPRYNATEGVMEKIPGSKGLLEALEPVKAELDDFLAWMIGERAARLQGEGRENLFSAEEITALQALRTQERAARFDQARADYQALNKAVLDVAEARGLIDASTRPLWEKTDYIPFYRINADINGSLGAGPRSRKGLAGQDAGIRRLRGGEEALSDPLTNIIQNMAHLLDASLKNDAALKTVEALEGTGVVERLKPSEMFKRALVPMSEVKAHMKASLDRNMGATVSEMIMDMIPSKDFEGLQKMWQYQPPADEDVIRVMVDGKPVYYRVDDPLVLRAVGNLAAGPIGGNSSIMRASRFFKRLLTGAVTADPAFMIRNLMRDAVSAWIISEDDYKLFVDAPRGLKKAFQESGGFEDMLFAGGSFQGGYLNAGDPVELTKAIRRQLRKRGMTGRSADEFMASIVTTPRRWMDAYLHLGEAMENASREAVYEAAINANKTKARAVYEARDLMDFSMRGDWAAIQFAADVLPFFNARLQGLYKLARSGSVPGPGMRKRAVMRGLTVMMFGMALLARNYDDDRYDELEDWDKDMYWHLFLGDWAPEHLQHIRIPKPFELGLLYGTIPERVMLSAARGVGASDTAAVEDATPAKLAERMLFAFRETLAMDPFPQIVRPVGEVFLTGKSHFTGRPVENIADKGAGGSGGKEHSERYSYYTSATMRELGQHISNETGVSPKELQHLWRGYLGTVGMYALWGADYVTRAAAGDPPRPEMRVDEIPVLKSFLRDQPAKNSRYVTEFYDALKESEQAYRSVRSLQQQGQGERAIDKALERIGEIESRQGLTRAQRQLSKIRKAMEQVNLDQDLTPAEKRMQIDALLKVRNDVAKQAVRTARATRNQARARPQ